jgi:putative ABC transport system substrate-binding protein
VMAYFTSIFETWRRLSTYVDRILKGAKPGELPVEQAVKFELVVNLKAAKAIGLSISESMLLRANKVIE